MPFEPTRIYFSDLRSSGRGGSTSYRARFHRLNYGCNSGCTQAIRCLQKSYIVTILYYPVFVNNSLFNYLHYIESPVKVQSEQSCQWESSRTLNMCHTWQNDPQSQICHHHTRQHFSPVLLCSLDLSCTTPNDEGLQGK